MAPRENDEQATTTEPSTVQFSVVMQPQNKQATTKTEDEAATKEEASETPSNKPSCLSCIIQFYWDNEFLILVVLAILIARAYPPLGADYLQPQITATWIAVVFIFIMAGLGLKTEEFTKALKQVYFNAFVQVFNFGVVSSIVFGFSRLMVEVGALDQALADGMVICGCLPLTVNMCLVLTKSAGGDEAAAIFNSAFGNMLGVFLSPVLILGYLGVTGDVDLLTTFYKLALRVVLPILIGQLLQKTSKHVVAFVKKYKKYFKKAQTYALVFIVYTVFCRTFAEEENQSQVGDIFLMILFQGIMLIISMVLAWLSLRLLFRSYPKLRVMGLFGCTHKTVAMGVPLINAIYENDPNVGLYTLPLLIWHPMQLVIGSALTPRLAAFVDREKERLGIVDEDDDGKQKSSTSSGECLEEGQGGISGEDVSASVKTLNRLQQ
eukprot:CAMPEP_0194049326 /NCGR_PEP_ID=MMETSP0009_2-20130614/30373_1 /TAXON_ID=210454 /ORGANISM="Grammatophora oceanica, Strain CCMP 410" /LENGTH=435 /DNA_ID=CAMNT_0038695453 /DNA_START=143 /DNA_END=1450 /DNA_ORIENTATION=-